MDGLRVLLVDSNTEQLARFAATLHSLNHVVMPTGGLDEASEALCAQKFDAVLLGSPLAPEDLQEFAAAVQTLDRNQRTFSKTPILLISDDTQTAPAPAIDARLSVQFGLGQLSEAVSQVHRQDAAKASAISHDPNLPVLNVEEFRAQVAFDDSLLVEIIDLFFEQCEEERPKMREAFTAQDLLRVSRIAHTIKGSLGTFHALRAKASAQRLETAAGAGNSAICGALFAQFERDLDELQPQLASLRSRTTPS